MSSMSEVNQLESLQRFLQRLNSEPAREGVAPTPDGKGMTLVISHVEMTLDELFFGQWSTRNFQWSAIANEVQGSLELVVIHPVSGREIIRTGAGSVVIMVDKVPDDVKNNPQLRNQWALNPSNKKANALDMAFPKLKAECLKNAALSFGKLFGRDLNRTITDVYKPFKLTASSTGLSALPESTMSILERQIREGLSAWELNKQMEAFTELITNEQKERLQNLYNELNPQLP
jgi:hypothetical protein